MQPFLFLSPHLDDAILSCGAYIPKLIQNNSKVVIATVFSGSIEPRYLSPLARSFHSDCKLGDNAMCVRRLEDKNAVKFIKAESIHLGLRECLYRRNKDGKHRYLHPNDIYNADLNTEKDIIDKIISILSHQLKLNGFEEIYIPLGVGRHIDHLILRKAVETLSIQICRNAKLKFYEDIPYACRNKDANWKTELTKGLNYYSYNINNEEFDIYLKAISFYKSQMRVLWDNKTEMMQQLNNYFINNNHKKSAGILWR